MSSIDPRFIFMKSKRAQKTILALVLILGNGVRAWGGQLSLGAQYQGWNDQVLAPNNGQEFLYPISLSVNVDKGWSFYGQTEFANGNYASSDTVGGPVTVFHLTNFSDTVLGTQISFNSLSLPSMLDVSFNVPTGNTAWEAEQVPANIPSDFVDTRYQGRGFGVSALYALSFPEKNGQFGAAVGYLYSGAFNPNYDLSPSYKLGDSYFVSLNHVRVAGPSSKETFRVSAFLSLATLEDSAQAYQMGPNFNASYSWYDTKGFSLELGGQAYLPARRIVGSVFTTETKLSLAPRFYANPSLALGNLLLAVHLKYVFPNNYSPDFSDASLYDGGGFMAGLHPSLRVPVDGGSTFIFSGSFDDIIAHNKAEDISGNPVDMTIYYWTLGTTYEIKI